MKKTDIIYIFALGLLFVSTTVCADSGPAWRFLLLNAKLKAHSDSYATLGNTLLEVDLSVSSGVPAVIGGPAPGTPYVGVLNNDKYPGSSGSLTAEVDASSVTPGSMVIMYSNGSFSYLPPVGFTGTDTFDYTLTDSSGFFDTGTVSINVSQMIWYVNENNMETADGRSGSPFQSLDPLDIDGSADELDRAGDTIFLFRGTGYTSDGFNLENTRFSMAMAWI